MSENLTLLEALEVVTKEIKEYSDGLDNTKADAIQDVSNAGKVWTVAEDGSLTFSDGGTDLTLDTTLTTEGQAADAKAVGDVIASLPVSLSDDGYSEVINQRKILNIQSTKTDDKINVVVSLEGNKKVVLDVEYNANNYPISLTINGRKCTFGWSGF